GYEPMQADNYLSDGSFAKSQMPRLAYIDEVRAQNVVMQLFPHRMMGNGDVLVRFEPNPGPATGQGLKPFEGEVLAHQVSGVHWLAMQKVWEERAFAMDPFAAEYVSEVVSMMITLWTLRGEQVAAQMGKKAIDAEVVLQERKIDSKDYVMVQPAEGPSAAW